MASVKRDGAGSTDGHHSAPRVSRLNIESTKCRDAGNAVTNRKAGGMCRRPIHQLGDPVLIAETPAVACDLTNQIAPPTTGSQNAIWMPCLSYTRIYSHHKNSNICRHNGHTGSGFHHTGSG